MYEGLKSASLTLCKITDKILFCLSACDLYSINESTDMKSKDKAERESGNVDLCYFIFFIDHSICDVENSLQNQQFDHE